MIPILRAAGQCEQPSAPASAEMYRVGNRTVWHYRAFIQPSQKCGNAGLAQNDYGRINVPVLRIWGDQDWSAGVDREQPPRFRLIPNV